MPITPDLLDEPAARTARLVALALLDGCTRASRRLVAGRAPPDDPEALHDFRVAVRRLRSWLRAFSGTLGDSVPARTARRLRAVAHATGASRDAEVHVAWLRKQRSGLAPRQLVGLAWLVERTLEQKRTADETLGEELTGDFGRVRRKLSRTLAIYTTCAHVDRGVDEPTFVAHVAPMLAEHGEALDRCLAEVEGPADQDEAHEARIAAKRLRYLLDPVAPHVEGGVGILDELKSLQSALGDMHDAHVFSVELLAASGDAAAERERRVTTAILAGDDGEERMREERRRDPRPGLRGIARRLRERGAHAFAEVERDWLADRSAPFFARLDAVVSALARRGAAGRDAERRLLLTGRLAEATTAPRAEIEEGNLPGQSGSSDRATSAPTKKRPRLVTRPGAQA